MPKITFECGCEFESENEGTHYLDVRFKNIDPRNFPFDCQATWNLLASGRTKGVWQFESPLGQQWCRKLKPRNMEHLSALNSLLRPGCLHAYSGDPPKSMTQRYCDRKNGVEPIEAFHGALDEILDATYQILCYQEQTLKISQKIAGFNLQEADILRKAMGKKKADIMAQVEGGFIEGCANTELVTEEEAKEIFGWIRESQKYSFNKSHSMSYAYLSYWNAYFKAHFPIVFFAAELKGSIFKRANQREEIQQLVDDAKIFDVDVQPPHFCNVDDPLFHIDGKTIRFGVGDVKHIGKASLTKLRKGQKHHPKPVQDWRWTDYLVWFSDCVSSTVNEALIKSGALDYLGLSRKQKLDNFADWNRLTAKEKEFAKKNYNDSVKDIVDLLTMIAPTKKNGGGTSNVNRHKVVSDMILGTKLTYGSKDHPEELVQQETHYLGLPITCHRVDGYIGREFATCTCYDFIKGFCGDKDINIAVQLESVREWQNKSGNDMCFIDVSDHSARMSCVCFSNAWKEYKHLLKEGSLLNICGSRSKLGSLSITGVFDANRETRSHTISRQT